MWHNNKTDYKGKLEEGYHEYEEIIVLDGTINNVMDKFKESVEAMLSNMFVESANDTALSRHEKMYGVMPLSRDDIEARRRKLLANFKDKPPVNDLTLKAICETYLGVEVDLKKHKSPYYFEIHYRNYKELIDATPLEKRLREVMPANLDFKVLYAFMKWEEVKVKTWGELKSKTWNDVLLGGV